MGSSFISRILDFIFGTKEEQCPAKAQPKKVQKQKAPKKKVKDAKVGASTSKKPLLTVKLSNGIELVSHNTVAVFAGVITRIGITKVVHLQNKGLIPPLLFKSFEQAEKLYHSPLNTYKRLRGGWILRTHHNLRQKLHLLHNIADGLGLGISISMAKARK